MKKITYFTILLTMLFSCSKDVEHYGIIKYVVETSRENSFIEYCDESQLPKNIYLEKDLKWEFSFEGSRGDLAYVIITNGSILGSSAVIKIYFNDELIESSGCSSNWVLTCSRVITIP